ncbi:MAG: hypothetical protein WBZ32_15500 [Candidatus Acidiferrales bacterium]
MGILGNHRGAKASGRRGRASGSGGNGTGTRDASDAASERAVQRRFTKELERTDGLAVMLASSRASGAVEVSDFLAAMYLNAWDRLERFWEEPDAIEEYLRRLCQVSPQRWHKWIQEYEAARQARERRGRGKFSLGRQRDDGLGEDESLQRSRGLESVLRRAGRIAPGHDRIADRSVPILTSESVLLAMSRDLDSEVGRRLAATGLDVEKLERAARKWRVTGGAR